MEPYYLDSDGKPYEQYAMPIAPDLENVVIGQPVEMEEQ